jgi:UDP-N-acetylglucosamine diphosphorylase / glucose-1-phosphate thymidylyltransferase / UDP-N-acetylgalactosamine diphosphorylase / glucosamine-1-phosphate N-acetyltransferase / galactosamine-1-phosphate N-acetyltransferase
MTQSHFSPKIYFTLEDFEYREIFSQITYVWQALDTLSEFISQQPLGHIQVFLPAGVFLENPELVSIGEGTIVEEGAYIKGPCIIGKHCQIRSGAYIRENALVGDHCVIGHTTEIKHSILLNHAKAAHFAFIGDSIIGNHVNLGAGTICANLRLDDSPVIVRYRDQSISTNRRKLGAIIGDKSQIGCKVVCNPGTIIGKRVHSFPNTTIYGVIDEGKIVKSSARTIIIDNC